MKRWFALLAASLNTFAALGQSTPPATSPQDSNDTLREMLCGNQGMPPTSTEIPTIGCFAVPRGGSARGMFDGHQFVVTVNARGEPNCRLDDAPGECGGCIGQNVLECPVRLMVLTHDADKSLAFSVQRKADGNRYLFRIDTWNNYLALRQSRQEIPVVQAPIATPAMPSPPLARGLAPASTEPTDGPGAMAVISWEAQALYGSGKFAKLDALIETLSQSNQLTDDGLPRLNGAYDGLWSFLNAWKDWERELDKIAQWRKEWPDSYGADLVEATLWRAWAWHTRGAGLATTVTPEGWKLFNDKISRADDVLKRSKPRASNSPLWYQLRLGIARDAGWDNQRYLALLDEATRRFPSYVPLYLWAANYLSPKWGGTYAAVDTLARSTTTVPLGSDYSLYTRVYWHVTNDEAGSAFDPFHDSLASWQLMKAGFEGLMKRYPKSKWNLNAYANFACRANDGPTYGVLRARIGQDVMQDAWASNYSVEVCDDRLLGHT